MVEHTESMVGFADWVKKNAPAYAAIEVPGPDLAGTVPVLLLNGPSGSAVHSLKKFADEYRVTPERRVGTAEMLDLASFIAHVNRFKDADSALFGDNDRAAPSLLSVLDYHERVNIPTELLATDVAEQPLSPSPRFGKHRTFYKFPLSDEWRAWHGHDGKTMVQADFAAFLEDRIGDVIPPPVDDGQPDATDAMEQLGRLLGGNFASPSRLLELSRGMQVHQNEKVRNAVNISTGEVQITYEAAHQDAQGAPLKVPNLFLIGIPVFRSGEPYRVAVRLRYRVKDGSVIWHYQLYRADKVFDHAFEEAAALAASATGLPLFTGKPE